MRKVDVTGQRFSRLVVLAMTRMGKYAGCLCRCDCGAEKIVRHSCLVEGVTKSCGCFTSDRVSAMNLKHGDTAGAPSTEWLSWKSMRDRCYNPRHKSYHHHGGRGICVCTRWLESFSNFLEDMGRKPSPAHSLDRYPDNDGNYEPSNCRWATKSEQARNRRSPQSKQMGVSL